ncbi:---NA---, partial [Paramuricea clavata]
LHRRDGVIISYQLCYSTQRLRSNCSSKGNVLYIEAENKFVRLDELLPATVYYFKVRAKTATGP